MPLTSPSPKFLLQNKTNLQKCFCPETPHQSCSHVLSLMQMFCLPVETENDPLNKSARVSPKQVLSPVSTWHCPGDVYPLVTTPGFSQGPVSCLSSPQRGWTGYLLPCQPEKIHTGPFTILDACWSTLLLWKSSVYLRPAVDSGQSKSCSWQILFSPC